MQVLREMNNLRPTPSGQYRFLSDVLRKTKVFALFFVPAVAFFYYKLITDNHEIEPGKFMMDYARQHKQKHFFFMSSCLKLSTGVRMPKGKIDDQGVWQMPEVPSPREEPTPRIADGLTPGTGLTSDGAGANQTPLGPRP